MVVHDVGSGEAPAIVEIAAGLAAQGITGRLVAIVGNTLANVDVPELRRAVVTPTPDGSDGFVTLIRLLDRQLALRADRRVPRIDDDPSWVVGLPGGSGDGAGRRGAWHTRQRFGGGTWQT